MARLTKKQAYDLGYKNGFTMAYEDGSSEAPSDGWDSLLISADPAFVKEKFGWDSQDSDDEATSLLDEYCKGCQAGADAACGGGEKAEIMASEVKAGFVVGDNGEIYVQLPADNQFGFVICDEDQSWDGGLGSGLTSWTLIASDDSRITDDDRDRLGWILDEQSSDMPASAKQTISVQWEFMGRATQEHFDAAQAVADAMKSCRSTEITRDIIESACDRLGQGWDYSAVLAMIRNCSFELIEQEASADA